MVVSQGKTNWKGRIFYQAICEKLLLCLLISWYYIKFHLSMLVVGKFKYIFCCCFDAKPSEETVDILNKIRLFQYFHVWTCNQGVHFYMCDFILLLSRLVVWTLFVARLDYRLSVGIPVCLALLDIVRWRLITSVLGLLFCLACAIPVCWCFDPGSFWTFLLTKLWKWIRTFTLLTP